jgi:PEP-CTERM motif
MPRLWKFAFAALLAALGTSSAQAGITTTLTNMSSTSTTTTFSYTLAFTTANFQGSDSLVSGNYLTLYDLYSNPSTLASSSLPAGFSVVQSLLGSTPNFLSPPPTDSPSLYNLSFLYSGAPVTVDTSFNVSFTLNGLFTTHSNNYTSLDQYNPNSGGIGQTATIGVVQTPFTPSVPEPSSLVLVGIAGVIGLASRRWRRADNRA